MNKRTAWYLSLTDDERERVHAFFDKHGILHTTVPINATVKRDGDDWLIEQYVKCDGRMHANANGVIPRRVVRCRVVAELPECWGRRP